MKARISLRVRAGASKTRFAGPHGDRWKLLVAAQPVKGKANDAIVRFLAKLIGVPASTIRIVTGQTASTKLIEIDGVSPDVLHRVILEANESRKNSGIVAQARS